MNKDELSQYGQAWFAGNFGGVDRTVLAQRLNQGHLSQYGIRAHNFRGQPLVYVGNRPPKYADICNTAAAQGDGGHAWKACVLGWIDGTVQFNALPALMQQLVVIVYFAEWGRYGGYVGTQFVDFLRNGSWANYKQDFPISLRYDEDAATEVAL